MHLDWPVAFSVFMLFVVWSFIYYSEMFAPAADIESGAQAVVSRVIDRLSVTVHENPVIFESDTSGPALLFAEIPIPEDSLQGLSVSSHSGPTDCIYSGTRLYWEADLDAGRNDFTVRYSGDASGGCSGNFPTAGANQTYPLATASARAISGPSLAALSTVPYKNFIQSSGIRGGIRLEWSGDLQGFYGPDAPGNRDVVVREASMPLSGSGGQVGLRVLLWE